MPLHDWTKVDPNIYHQLHGRWIFAIQEVLNDGRLADEYYAMAEEGKPRHIAIRHISGHRVAAVIEITSPSNKSRCDELSAFVQKAVVYLEQGIHLLVIDLFPPSMWDKHGLHAAIWKKFRERAAPRPNDKQLTLVSYQANDTVTAYFEPVAVGDSLIEMPLFLTATQYVNVPLEQTYRVSWNSVPKFWQDVVTR